MNNYGRTKFDNLLHFLRKHIAHTDTFTHTSIYDPAGKYNIPDSKLTEFYNLYSATLNEGVQLHFTEKPNLESSPLRCDLDFRFKQESLKRQYKMDDIQMIMKAYMGEIEQWTTLHSETGETSVTQRICCMLEKTSPTFKDNKDEHKKERIVKDGVHIIFPFLVSDAYLQEMVRKEVCDKIDISHLNMICSNEDVFDSHVIFRNNWQLYGSRKPNKEQYKLTHMFEVYEDKCVPIDIPSFLEANGGEDQLVHLMKVHRPENERVQIKEDKKDEFLTRQKSMSEYQSITKKLHPVCVIAEQEADSETLDTVTKLVRVLSTERADDYKKWIELGWCLYNIHNVDDRLLDVWIQFSKQCPKYVDSAEESCTNVWNNAINGGIKLATLYFWAKSDNPKKYHSIMRKLYSEELSKVSAQLNEFDIAKLMYQLYNKAFVCVSVKEKVWYRFNGTRWVRSEQGIDLKKLISTEMYDYITKNYSSQLQQQNHSDSSVDSDDDIDIEREQTRREEENKKTKKFIQSCQRLKKTSMKSNIMSECTEQFYNYSMDFYEKLDSNINLIGFENGVYELDTGLFRPGRPDDYLTLNTKIDYEEFHWEHELVLDVLDFFRKIYTHHEIREYVLTMISTFLSGSVREEKFPIWTGTGANGKSKLVELIMGTMGEYCANIPITLLTRKRADAGNANPHMAQTRGKRMLVLQEPSENEKFNVGLMKELSGGDKIVVRQLYDKPIEFKPQFHMIMICNEMPKLPADDEAVWRRVRVTQHRSKFKDKPNPNNPLEFEKDRDISIKMQDWFKPFMWVLLQYFKRYQTEGLSEPEKVLEYTRQYQQDQDQISEFIKETFSRTSDPNDKVYAYDAYDEYKIYFSGNQVKLKQKNPFIKIIKKVFGEFTITSQVPSKQGWKGYKIITKYERMMMNSEETDADENELEDSTTNGQPKQHIQEHHMRQQI